MDKNDIAYALVYLERNWLARVLSHTKDKLCPSMERHRTCHSGMEDKDECYRCWLDAAREAIR